MKYHTSRLHAFCFECVHTNAISGIIRPILGNRYVCTYLNTIFIENSNRGQIWLNLVKFETSRLHTSYCFESINIYNAAISFAMHKVCCFLKIPTFQRLFQQLLNLYKACLYLVECIFHSESKYVNKSEICWDFWKNLVKVETCRLPTPAAFKVFTMRPVVLPCMKFFVQRLFQ